MQGEAVPAVSGVDHRRAKPYIDRRNAKDLERQARKAENQYRWEADQVDRGRMSRSARTVTKKDLDDLWKEVKDARS